MRKEYSSALRKIFDYKINNKNFGFVKYKNKKKSDLIFGGELVYLIDLTYLYCCLILVPHLKAEKFTLELGWSEKNKFPAVKTRPVGFLSLDKKELIHSDFIFRIGDLIDKNDYWWTIEDTPNTLDGIIKSMENKITKEEAMAKVVPHVDNAIQIIDEYVIPFFSDLKKKKGL
jgi:hypothetical protein